MAENNIPVTSGSGNNVDTFTLNNPANQRQSVVIGDSAINLNTAPVQSTDPSSNTQGLVVRDINTSAIVSKLTSGVSVSPGTGTLNVQFDPGHTLGNVGINSVGTSNTLSIFIPDTGHTLGKVDQGNTGSVGQAWFTNASYTASIFSASGSANGISVSGNTIISPSANYSFKIYAINVTTTAQDHLTVKFTNGSGGSPVEFWRYALQAPSQGISGANIAIPLPSHFFATGTSTTLSMVLDTASLVHYSVSYIKESS